ncbi:MAG: aminotransferase class V-fold PLP-dependent enzyme [Gammaproteobacteria bacterium]|nr:MAG: aminotransferase class V-fold PLP-dependent enzyme [Gammaproteobacteria bacterium]
MSSKPQGTDTRIAPANLDAEEFRTAGHRLVDSLADFFSSLPERPITRADSPQVARELIGTEGLPEHGTDAGALLDEVTRILTAHSLHNGHPRFLGYITSSAAPLGALADLLAASINANVVKWDLSPIASEIEAQTVRWLAELTGFPTDCGGLMVSGGNLANIIAFMTARTAQAAWDVRARGLHAEPRQLTVYASKQTHTWIEKAADVTGIGTDAIRWIDTDTDQRIDIDALERCVDADVAAGCLPFMIVGTAGNVSTGAVDSLPDIAAVCAKRSLWFHVDGAYGAPAAALPEASPELKALALADSIALDPHKWLYAPIEAACVLVRNPETLPNAFCFQPEYYSVEAIASDGAPGNNYYELGLQNTRGFRALKVWLGLRHVGRSGYVQMIRDDIALAQQIYRLAEAHPELEACTQHLSITTFRYRPAGYSGRNATDDDYLNKLNRQLLTKLQTGGDIYVSNAIIGGRYYLRTCVVNFRTTAADIEALPEIVVAAGRHLDSRLRPTRP